MSLPPSFLPKFIRLEPANAPQIPETQSLPAAKRQSILPEAEADEFISTINRSDFSASPMLFSFVEDQVCWDGLDGTEYNELINLLAPNMDDPDTQHAAAMATSSGLFHDKPTASSSSASALNLTEYNPRYEGLKQEAAEMGMKIKPYKLWLAGEARKWNSSKSRALHNQVKTLLKEAKRRELPVGEKTGEFVKERLAITFQTPSSDSAGAIAASPVVGGSKPPVSWQVQYERERQKRIKEAAAMGMSHILEHYDYLKRKESQFPEVPSSMVQKAVRELVKQAKKEKVAPGTDTQHFVEQSLQGWLERNQSKFQLSAEAKSSSSAALLSSNASNKAGTLDSAARHWTDDKADLAVIESTKDNNTAATPPKPVANPFAASSNPSGRKKIRKQLYNLTYQTQLEQEAKALCLEPAYYMNTYLPTKKIELGLTTRDRQFRPALRKLIKQAEEKGLKHGPATLTFVEQRLPSLVGQEKPTESPLPRQTEFML